MPHSLVIVESPTKVKTIRKYLGSDFEVQASMGHIKDLPKSKLGIDPEKDFETVLNVIDTKKKVVTALTKAAKEADHIYLAPDPDREGEAIAWHIAEEIGRKKAIHRVLFNDLTKKTVLEAMKHPLELDVNKYEAQQTRRILDRLVGYKISPILWDKVKRGLSAGRVQSVAVRIICDREEDIRKFVSEEYWNITAELEGKNPPPFEARLIKIEGKKAKVGNEAESQTILDYLKTAQFVVAKQEKKEIKRSSLPPFTTSKLQQEASRWLRFSAKKTMSVAQKLYEGIELGAEGPVGLITYMRTDSVRTADEAIGDVRKYIEENYSPEFLPEKPRFFKNSATSQDAHEAIRPSSMSYRPQDIKNYLSNDEFRLYQLIWNRFTASQMNPAVLDQTVIETEAGKYLFRAQGTVMKFPGYTIVYTEGKENGESDDEFAKTLPEVSVGETVKLISLKPEQKFTQPPPRFTEASLVRELEENGIGRPSTYATILSTIQDREYVRLEKGRFIPTELGMLVTELLVNNFPKILDIEFTASMENQLDEIEEGKKQKIETLNDFYSSFQKELRDAELHMRNVKKEETPTDFVCDKCGSPMIIKWGKRGRFVACSNYPACKNTMNVPAGNNGEAGITEVQPTDIICTQCGKGMVIKEGRFGKFLGCSGYPECKNTLPLDLGIQCPEKGCPGRICERRTKKGKVFFSCTNYPTCTFAMWDKPLPEPCPQCGAPFLVEKHPRRGGPHKACRGEDCKYKAPLQ
ncbi:MAG TPA: type I DNA topoisomerase [Syntrophales bacterium]|nr:type I DNA topoisomerase [Syntrophales bacterium]